MTTPLSVLIIGATGGLGKCLVQEALARKHTVSVLIRNKEKFNAEFNNMNHVWPSSSIFIGDATKDVSILKKACEGKDVVLIGIGAVESIARNVAEQSKEAGVKKVIHVAGATNVMDADGTTPLWKKFATKWPPAEKVFIAHGKCIDAIRRTGINHVIFCPAFMNSKEKKSSPVAEPKINRESGDYISYEDAAHIMLNAAEQSKWDGELITAATVVE
jgi:putative NADH-flavin reductase